MTAAADAAAKQMPADFRVSITNPPGDAAYPIASFTWLLLYEDAQDKTQATMMVDFMKWALTDGQKFAPGLGYAPLPKAVVDLELKALEKIKTQVAGACSGARPVPTRSSSAASRERSRSS